MVAKIYVSDLSPKTTDATLNDAFADFGVVLDAIVMRSPNTGLSLRFGFVLYETGDEAQAAIYGMNEQELDGYRIKVKRASAWNFKFWNRQEGSSGGFMDGTKLSVSGLDSTTTEGDLGDAFEGYGTVNDTTVTNHSSMGFSRRIGYVYMAKTTEALAAVEALDGSE